MIKVSLDEAYVFDLLSIYEVKYYNSNGDKKESLSNSLSLLSNEIKLQIGDKLYEEIINSKEYHELKLSNLKVFQLVEMANKSELSKITADANYERFKKKMDLQHKFFNLNLTEVKI